MDLLHSEISVKWWSSLLRAITPVAFALFSLPAAAELEELSGFGENPGNLRMYLHKPSEFREGLPLLVALHGCTQTATGFDDETGLVSLAEETPFLLLLPEQRTSNMSRRCFRWHDSNDNRPGLGESASILEMIDFVIETQAADPERVFVMGLSAGGAMTAVMLANHPGRFAGGAIIAGLPYDCNRPAGFFDISWNWLHFNPYSIDGADASYACGIVGFSRTDRDAADWAGYVLANAESIPDQWPLISLWQGRSDATVDPDNLRELTEQWTAVQGIDAVADESESIGNALREVYRDDAGLPRIETWSLDGFAHGVPIDADARPDDCGQAAEFILDADLCAVRRIADFWQLR